MTGKIFSDSTNIFCDEARVLFDYYKKAAEKIVGEEKDLEEKIEDAKKSKEYATSKKKKNKILTIVFAILLGLAAGATTFFVIKNMNYSIYSGIAATVFLIVMIVSIVKMKNATTSIKIFSDNISAFESAWSDIRRDYKIEKLGVVYVPLASRVPFEDKSFVVDHTGHESNTDFTLSILHKPNEFQDTLRDIESSIKEVPVVESNENAESVDTSGYSKSVQNVVMHDYIGGLDRQVRNISYLLSDNDEVSVSLPIVTPDSDYDKFLNEYATSDTGEKPVVKVFNTDTFSQKFQAFAKLNDMKKELEKISNSDNVTYMKTLMKRLATTTDVICKMKVNSTSKLVNYTNAIFSCVLKASSNQYSAALEAEEIARIREATFDFQDSVEDYTPFHLRQSSRVRYDLAGGAWVAEDGSRTNMPFAVNQIQEEVLMPVINNLMNETRVERLKIYNNIKDQKMHYLNEWNKDVEAAFRDNRKSGQDLVMQITKAYSEYNTAYQTYLSYKNTQDAMKKSNSLESAEVETTDNAAEQVMGFEAQAQQCNAASEDFQNYMDRLQDDIAQKSAQFEHIDYYEAVLRDTQARDTARSLDTQKLQELSERQKRLIAVNTYDAVFAKLPPDISIEEKLQADFDTKLTDVADNLLNQDTKETSEEVQNGNV